MCSLTFYPPWECTGRQTCQTTPSCTSKSSQHRSTQFEFSKLNSREIRKNFCVKKNFLCNLTSSYVIHQILYYKLNLALNISVDTIIMPRFARYVITLHTTENIKEDIESLSCPGITCHTLARRRERPMLNFHYSSGVGFTVVLEYKNCRKGNCAVYKAYKSVIVLLASDRWKYNYNYFKIIKANFRKSSVFLNAQFSRNIFRLTIIFQQKI